MKVANIVIGGIASVMGIGIIIFIARAIMRSNAFVGPSIVEIAIFLGVGAFLLIVGLRFVTAGIKGKKTGAS